MNFRNHPARALWQRLGSLAAALALSLSLAACSPAAELPARPSVPASSNQTEQTTEAGLNVHFLDVGQALSVLVECEGEYLLYDGGNVDDGSYLVSYLYDRNVEELKAVFCSHAHEDHVGGLAAALAAIPADHVYAPVTTADTKCFRDFVKYTEQQNLSVEVPAVGDRWQLGSAEVELLGPVADYADTNDTSLVLRIDYGQTSFLLTGDMEKNAESDLLNSGANVRADVLQVGHHGSDTSTGYVFLRTVQPEIAVISVGAGNSYGHPHTEPLSRLRDAGADVYRTDLLGAVVVSSDGKNYTVRSEGEATDSELNPTRPEETTQSYIGNRNSKKVHLLSCTNLPAEKNQVLFTSLAQAEAEGYTPCSTCIK